MIHLDVHKPFSFVLSLCGHKQGRDVVAVWVKGALPQMPVSGTVFTRAVRLRRMGTTQEKRKFIADSGKDFLITENNSVQCNFSKCSYWRHGT